MTLKLGVVNLWQRDVFGGVFLGDTFPQMFSDAFIGTFFVATAFESTNVPKTASKMHSVKHL